MIIVKLQGGLGNQMFQYAMAKQLAILNNTFLKIDRNHFANNNNAANITVRKYELAIFRLDVAEATIQDINYFTKKSHLLGRIIKKISGAKIINETAYSFDPNYNSYGANCYLNGYWQNEKYFRNISSVIKAEFEFKNTLVDDNAKVCSLVNSSNSVSLHIRRGDYVDNASTNEFHGTCSMEYYRQAISLINTRVDNPHFFIFSDDVDWVKANFKLDILFTIVDINDEDNCGNDLHLISLCKHNIMANSSFSWWGAWLNNNNNKVVIGPKKWFNDTTIDTSTLLPDNWFKI